MGVYLTVSSLLSSGCNSLMHIKITHRETILPIPTGYSLVWFSIFITVPYLSIRCIYLFVFTTDPKFVVGWIINIGIDINYEPMYAHNCF